MSVLDLLPYLTALWMGVLTSLHPCTLAPNLAAISFVSKTALTPRRVLCSGILYTAGRMCSYLALSWLTLSGLLAMPTLALFLQTWGQVLLGPFFVCAGIVLLELLPLRFRFRLLGHLQKRFPALQNCGAFALGMLLALALCPPTAALLFGVVVPLSLHTKPTWLLPLLYGAGTGLPVLFCAVVFSTGARSAANLVGHLQSAEKSLRMVSGIVLTGIGIWLTLHYNYQVI